MRCSSATTRHMWTRAQWTTLAVAIVWLCSCERNAATTTTPLKQGPGILMQSGEPLVGGEGEIRLYADRFVFTKSSGGTTEISLKDVMTFELDLIQKDGKKSAGIRLNGAEKKELIEVLVDE